MSSNQLIQSANWTISAANNGTRRVLSDRFEGRNYSTSYHMSRGLGFFVAPKTGTYKFTMLGDDLFQLQGLYHNVRSLVARRGAGLLHGGTACWHCGLLCYLLCRSADTHPWSQIALAL